MYFPWKLKNKYLQREYICQTNSEYKRSNTNATLHIDYLKRCFTCNLTWTFALIPMVHSKEKPLNDIHLDLGYLLLTFLQVLIHK